MDQAILKHGVNLLDTAEQYPIPSGGRVSYLLYLSILRLFFLYKFSFHTYSTPRILLYNI